MNNIVLASKSPRRQELLSKFNISFEVIGANIEESIMSLEEPKIVAMALAFEKAMNVADRLNDERVVVSADTIVVLDDKILAKPKSREDAKAMLGELSGKEHKVITGLSIVSSKTNKKIVDYEETLVKFRKLEDDYIDRYLDTGEYIDKAGAYGIQGVGSVLIERIEGSYFNVVGLPIYKLDILLEHNFKMNLL